MEIQQHIHNWIYDNEFKKYRCGCGARSTTAIGLIDKEFFQAMERPTDLASPNPKDAVGERKVSLSKLPAIALLHCAHALQNGADKYGAYNWRDHSVLACIYVDAALRHLLAWLEGEETAKDSGVHHLGHAMACCAILLDAQARGNLLDDRPKGDPTIVPRVLDAIAEVVQEQREKRK